MILSAGSNTNGGQVQLRTRYKSQVNYFVRPKYTKSVTADMVIATARSQVGIKESPKNSNKVKYNEWFYGKNQSAYWCCTFVCWVFAHVKEPEKPLKKPTGKYAGTIPEPTLKKGSKGERVVQWQKFLTWYGIPTKPDGGFGEATKESTIVFQRVEGIGKDGVYGKNSHKHALAYKYVPPKSASTAKKTTAPTKTSTTAKKAVKSTTNAQKLLKKMDELAWAYGTSEKK